MCGYCIERNVVLALWQYGEFRKNPAVEPLFCDTYSIECPSFSQLLALRQAGQPLLPTIVLLRLAIQAHSKPLSDTEQQLHQLMLGENNACLAQSDWPLIDQALTHIFAGKDYPKMCFGSDTNHTGTRDSTDLQRQVEAAACWAADRFYPPEPEPFAHLEAPECGDTSEAWQQVLLRRKALLNEFYLVLPQLYLALLYLQHVQPQHPCLQQIALNRMACDISLNAYELAFKRLAQRHCVKQFGMTWFWRHFTSLPTVNIFYLAACLRFSPADILTLQLRLPDEHHGEDTLLSRQECVSALNGLGDAIEFSFPADSAD